MGTLTAKAAKKKADNYKDLLQDIIDQSQKNFDDMDFENADREDEMEKVIQEIKNDCESAKTELDALYFEE